MNDARKKSPRAPSMPLDEAVDKASGIYDKERRHAAPVDVIAQNLGYKSANNGAALSAIATLRAFGLLEKAQDGKLAVSKDVETYRFAPSEEMKNSLRIKWLRSPGIFGQLLDGYVGGLPSDANLRFDLIERGFSPASAESTLGVLKKSVEFARYFELHAPAPAADAPAAADDHPEDPSPLHADRANARATGSVGADRIPVRLAGGRRAWLEIPTPFYEADKEQLVAQINLILTDDEEKDIG
jgi:hypothetical protein